MKTIIFLSLAIVIFLTGIFLIRKAAPPENAAELYRAEFPSLLDPAFFISENLTGHFQK